MYVELNQIILECIVDLVQKYDCHSINISLATLLAVVIMFIMFLETLVFAQDHKYRYPMAVWPAAVKPGLSCQRERMVCIYLDTTHTWIHIHTI